MFQISDTLLHFETRARQRRLGSKIEDKFHIFMTTLKFRREASELGRVNFWSSS